MAKRVYFRNSIVGHCARIPFRNIAVNSEAVAERLDVLASRVRRISPPLAGNPNRFHEERSEIAGEIAALARSLAPRRVRTSAVKVTVTESRAARTVVATQVINGRRVQVQRRQAFAVSTK